MTELERIRLNSGLTQDELAKRVGVSPSLMCFVEKGLRDFSGQVWLRVAKVLGVDVNEILKERV